MRHAAKFWIIFLALCVIQAAFGQRDFATLVGTVTDASGSALPNAKVVIIEDATGLRYEVTTNGSGEYIRPALKPGIYSVEVEATGFKKGVQHGFNLTSGDRTAINVQLTLGDMSQSVEISAAAPLLQTESTIIGQDLGAKQVSELPLGGQRTFTYLARLSPGVVPAEPGARDAAGGGFSANGVRSNGQNNFLLNGVDNNVNVIDFLNQTAYVIGPSVEAIGEMRVLTNGYNAEYGRGAGGVVNVSLKSGTNEVHGAVFEFLQNDKLNANTWENNKNGTARQPYHQNQFGAAVGGPIRKNRTFIFGDYQGTRIAAPSGQGANFTIPTLAERSGDFSALLGGVIGTDAAGNPIRAGQIYDPSSQTCITNCSNPDPSQRGYTRTAFANNIIPASRIDPAGQKLINLFPTPTSATAAGTRPNNNYFNPTNATQQVDQGDVRVDHRISDRDSIFGSLSWSDTNKFNAQPLPGALDATYFNSNSEVDLARNAMISYTRVWNPSIISETRAAFTRLVTSRLQANPGVDQFKAFGIGGYNPTTTLNGGLPSVGIDNYSGFGASDWLPSKEYNNVLDFIQNVAINKGAHAYKVGVEYRPIKFPFFQVPSPHGDLSFSRNDTAYPSKSNATDGNPLNNVTGDAYASFLLGNINSGGISSNNFISSQKSAYAFYAQDDWKVSSRLTVNVGIRYELFSPIGERFGRQSNFNLQTLTLDIPKGKDQNAALPPNFATQFPQITVRRGTVDKFLIPWDKTDFSPRIGFAYQLNSKTVVRAGYGIFYGGEENQGGYPNRGEAVPFNESVNLNRAVPGTAYSVGDFGNNQYFNGLQYGFPINVFALPAPVSFRGVSQDFRNPLVHKWNVAIQRELGGNTALELAYVGNHQAHQVSNPDPNAPYITGDPNANYDARRPYPNIGGIAFTDTYGFGNYAGLTAKLEKRYSAGLNATASYTYGHALSSTGTTLTGSNAFGSPDPRNNSLAYASAAWDIRHNVVASFTYDLPYGRGRRYGSAINGPLNFLLGGWQANGILSFRSGPPFGIGSNACVGVWGSCRPDVVPGKDPKNAPSSGRTPDLWFNTSAVVPPHRLANGFGTPGNLGAQSNNAPPTRTADLSLFKTLPITERYRFQFRAEAFNIGNTPQFSQPDPNLQDSNFGKVLGTQTASERRMQVSLRFQF
jgi:hypothetical protein